MVFCAPILCIILPVNLVGWNDTDCGDNDSQFPMMSTLEYSFLVNIFTAKGIENSVVLEWGSGGSTNYIAWYAKLVFTIEHSRKRCDEMLLLNSTRCNLKRNKLILICFNYTDTKRYGAFINETKVLQKSYRRYVEIGNELFLYDNREKPDIIFIDGRFRVACALQGVILLRHRAVSDSSGFILIHDYTHRSQYHILEKYLIKVRSVETLTLLILRNNIDWNQLAIELEFYLGQQS